MQISSVLCVFLAVLAAVSASDVLVLTTDNFDSTIAENPLILVEFYAPWCGHCKHLAPEYEKAATMLKDQGIAAKLASVDADDSKNTALREQFDIKGFPTIKLFRNGVPTDYEGERTADSIFETMRRNSLPAVTTLTSLAEAKTFSESDKVIVIGFFNDKESTEYKVFSETASQLRDSFTFGEVIGQADVNTGLESGKVPSVVVFKQFDDKRASFDVTSFEGLANFIKSNTIPLLDEIGPHNFKSYMDSGLPLAYLFVDLSVEGQKEKVLPEVQELAKETKGKLSWVYIDWAKYAKHSERLGLSGKTVPALAIEKMEEGLHYVFDETAAIAKDGITAWVNTFLGGKLEPTIKSEEIPESNDGPVKIVVAKNFDEIVNDKTKDVLLEFYAPWCGHCKKLAPVFDELGTNMKSHSNIVIAKIDATANDISPKFGVRGFPTIKLFKAGDKENPVDYEGDRSLADMTSFLEKEAGVAERKDEL